LDYRVTIEEVHKIIPTNGSSPVLVTCDDIEEWVCKYDQAVMSLFNEYIASSFLKLWGLNTPPISFITVEEDHIPESMRARLQLRYFQKHCFGSKFMMYAKEIDDFFKTFKGNYYETSKIASKKDFLKIGLFDIWLSNEDRNHNNFNLLLNPDDDGFYSFYAIDHVACFNTSNLHMQLAPLTKQDSILTTDVANVLFSKGTKLSAEVDNLVQDFYLCTNRCRQNLDGIIADVPDSWGIKTNEISDNLEKIFDEEWLQQTEEVFRQYVQVGIR
jgi:hypothetical protein